MGRRRSGGADVHGIVILDKPAGWTSHDVVAKSRGVLGTPRVGHSGTLDPDATGVLVLGVGRATRLLRFLQGLPKSYSCEVVLGVETSTLDAAGEVTASHDMSAVTPAAVEAAAATLRGDILQVPPMVSAIKIGGRRLHEMARAGEEIERPPRPVRIDRFDLEPTDDPMVYRAIVDCSSGTYVRSLAADLGAALGGGAHLRALRRHSVGPFIEAEASTIETPVLLPAEEAFRGVDGVTLDAELERAVRVGSVLADERLGVTGDGPWPVFNGTGRILAVYERRGPGRVKPAVVLV